VGARTSRIARNAVERRAQAGCAAPLPHSSRFFSASQRRVAPPWYAVRADPSGLRPAGSPLVEHLARRGRRIAPSRCTVSRRSAGRCPARSPLGDPDGSPDPSAGDVVGSACGWGACLRCEVWMCPTAHGRLAAHGGVGMVPTYAGLRANRQAVRHYHRPPLDATGLHLSHPSPAPLDLPQAGDQGGAGEGLSSVGFFDRAHSDAENASFLQFAIFRALMRNPSIEG
jgi:hypothetical protein